MTLKYVTNADGKGWLIVRHADGLTYPPLPQLLKVDLTRTIDNREYFEILEGRLEGKEASVKKKGTNESYLGEGSHSGPAKVRFNLAEKKLWYGSYGPVTAVAEVKPLTSGIYDLEIPYEAHQLGAAYEGQTPFAKTWFRIGHTGDHFLHPGAVSEGCVTVKDVSVWTEIYSYLIRSRKDTMSVGTIEII